MADIKQRTEERSKEHHFREDEPEHAEHIAVTQLGAIHALQVFFDGGSEPARQGQRKECESDVEHPANTTLAIAKGHVVEHECRTEDGGYQSNRRADREA